MKTYDKTSQFFISQISVIYLVWNQLNYTKFKSSEALVHKQSVNSI